MDPHSPIRGEMARYIRDTTLCSTNLSKFFASHCVILRAECSDSWKDRPEGPFPLRVEQLKLRHTEVYEVFSKMKGLADGKHTSLRSTLHHEDLEAWKSTFASDNVLLTGHSLGGATSVSDHAIGFYFTCLAQRDLPSCIYCRIHRHLGIRICQFENASS